MTELAENFFVGMGVFLILSIVVFYLQMWREDPVVCSMFHGAVAGIYILGWAVRGLV